MAINGKVVGKTPLEKMPVAPGAYEVLVQDSCYFPSGKKVEVERNKTENLDVSPAPREGAITVTAEGRDGNAVEASVYVDGVKIGTTSGTYKIRVCAKKLEVRHPKLGTFARDVAVREKQVVSVRALLRNETVSDLARATAECLAGKVVSCVRACARSLSGQEEVCRRLSKDPSFSVGVFERACDAGKTESCKVLGNLYMEQLLPGADFRKREEDYARAVGYYRRACGRGSASGCASLAFAYFGGFGVEKDAARAAEFDGKACDGGVEDACQELALFPGEDTLAALYSPQAHASSGTELPEWTFPSPGPSCAAGDLAACARSCVIMDKNACKRLEDKPMPVVARFQKGCDSGDPGDCYDLGRMYEGGHGVKQDFARATGLFRQACDAGEAYGCGSLIPFCEYEYYGKPAGIPKDENRATELSRKACDGGFEPVCTKVNKKP